MSRLDDTSWMQAALVEALKLAGIDAPMLQQEKETPYLAPSHDGDDDHEDDDEHEESETDDD